MSRPITAEELQEVINRLHGTCMNTLDNTIMEVTNSESDIKDLTEEQHDEIDNKIFECEQCGWWCDDRSSFTDENICSDCDEDSYYEYEEGLNEDN